MQSPLIDDFLATVLGLGLGFLWQSLGLGFEV